MTPSELAAHVLHQLRNGHVDIHRRTIPGDKEFGVETPIMLKLSVIVHVPGLLPGRMFQSMDSLLPRGRGRAVTLGCYHAPGRMAFDVYFPMPYGPADRHPQQARSTFIARTALYLIAQQVRRACAGDGAQLPPAPHDPRHPDDVRAQGSRVALRGLLARLWPAARSVENDRTFVEYL